MFQPFSRWLFCVDYQCKCGWRVWFSNLSARFSRSAYKVRAGTIGQMGGGLLSFGEGNDGSWLNHAEGFDFQTLQSLLCWYSMQNSGWLNFCARESRGKTCFHYAERSQKCIYEGLKHFFEGRNCVYIARLARVFGLDVSMLPIENPMSIFQSLRLKIQSRRLKIPSRR